MNSGAAAQMAIQTEEASKDKTAKVAVWKAFILSAALRASRESSIC
jgi:hypothetical protein